MATDRETTRTDTATRNGSPNIPNTEAVWPTEWQGRLLLALRGRINLSSACQRASVGRTTVYDRMAMDPVYAQAVEDARHASIGVLEDAVYERAVKHDTPAALAILKAKLPDEYDRARRTEVEVNVSGVVAHLRSSYTLEELSSLRDALQAQEEATLLLPAAAGASSHGS